MTFTQRLEKTLVERKKNELYRTRKILSSAQADTIDLYRQDKSYTNFCSNDYLGLANHPKIIKSFQDAAKKYGVGSGASHLVIGHHQEHHLLEQELAEFLGVERTLVFGSGFAANVGVLTSLLQKKDSVFHDKLNHASLLDGGLYSGARFQRFLHKDIESLEKKLSATDRSANKLIVSDAVFSMDGDCADIEALITTAKSHDAWLMLDDAHGFGVLGEEGRGSVSLQAQNQQDINIYMATFGKALGTSGAFIAGNELLIESLIQLCRHYIYSTAMPPALAAASRTALGLMREESWRQDNLHKRVKQFKAGAIAEGLALLASDTAIQPLVLGSSERAMNWSEKLAKRGLLISAIREPTVAKGSARLRITLSASHSEAQVAQLLTALSDLNAQDNN